MTLNQNVLCLVHWIHEFTITLRREKETIEKFSLPYRIKFLFDRLPKTAIFTEFKKFYKTNRNEKLLQKETYSIWLQISFYLLWRRNNKE